MEINTTTAFASAAISAIFGFGIAYTFSKVIFKNQSSKFQRAISGIGSISLGYGLMGIANEIIGFPLQGLATRVDKIVNYSIINILFIPAICWIIYLILNRKNGANAAQANNQITLSTSPYKSSKIIIIIGAISIIGWITLYITKNPNIHSDKNNFSAKNTTEEKVQSTATNENNRICQFLWNESTGTFTSLSDDIKDMNNFTNTVIFKSSKTEYINSLIPQLREADKKGNDTLAREITKEIQRNSITVYFNTKLSPDFIQTLASNRNIENQCN